MILSVVMITYKHENYIKKAIDSVLNQETNFEFELLISNDNSPDSTDEIILKIVRDHPKSSCIKYINNKINIGMMSNFTNTLKKSKGKYIALCEGDDYWTDRQKLQKQVDFLEANTDFAICFHNVNIDKNNSIEKDTITNVPRTITSIEDLSKGNYIHTCSVVYRNNMFKSYPEYFYNAPVGDYFLHMLNSRFGKIYCLQETMAHYRVHDTSYWSSKQQAEREKIWIEFIKNIKENFEEKIQKNLTNQIYLMEKRGLKGVEKTLFKIKYFFKKLFSL